MSVNSKNKITYFNRQKYLVKILDNPIIHGYR